MSNDTSNHLLDRAAIATDNATAQAVGAAQRGVAAMRNGSQQMLDHAHHASDSTVSYIRDEPVKSMLIAAATGAALMALVGLMTRPSTRG